MSSESVNETNIHRIAEAMREIRQKVYEQGEQIKKLNGVIAALQADLSNTKQLTAHVLGRGNGPTA